MQKTYNHLIKKQEFTTSQLMQISLGIEQDLNVEIYAKKEFSNIYMYEVRMCLLDNVFITNKIKKGKVSPCYIRKYRKNYIIKKQNKKGDKSK